MENEAAVESTRHVTSSDDYAFIQRTLYLLQQYKELINNSHLRGQKIVSYSRTLFVNCCIGLLFIPRERLKDDTLFNSPVREWGIDPAQFNVPGAPHKELMANDLIRHLRNALGHDHFDCLYQENMLSRISFKDYDRNGKITFSGSMTYKDFELLVGLLAGYTLESD